jgi:hypothetical protein
MSYNITNPLERQGEYIQMLVGIGGPVGGVLLVNHLREILNQILLQKGSDFQVGNYHAKAEEKDSTVIITIYHVKYMGFDQFESALWNETDNELRIMNADICQEGEIIFILRSFKSTGMQIQKMYEIANEDPNGLKEEVTAKYQKYL